MPYRNEEEHAKLKPTKTNPKEVSFIKNNPREKELTGKSEEKDPLIRMQEEVKNARQRQINDLKKSLLAPIPPPG